MDKADTTDTLGTRRLKRAAVIAGTTLVILIVVAVGATLPLLIMV